MSLLVCSKPDTHKIRHIARSPKVSLHFSTYSEAQEVSVLTEVSVLAGEADLDPSAPPADEHAQYLEKYRKGIADLEMTPREFASDYSVTIRVSPKRLRGF